MATRWRWPPESSCGRRDPKVAAGLSPTVCSISETRSRRSTGSEIPWIASGSSTILQHLHPRVERFVRGLEDDLRLARRKVFIGAPSRSDERSIGESILHVEQNPAGGGFQQTHEQFGRRCFSAAGFPHQPQGFPAADRKLDVVDRVHTGAHARNDPALDGEEFRQMAGFHERRRSRGLHGIPARGVMAAAVILPVGDARRANLQRARAARMEAAAGGRMQEIRRLAGQG